MKSKWFPQNEHKTQFDVYNKEREMKDKTLDFVSKSEAKRHAYMKKMETKMIVKYYVQCRQEGAIGKFLDNITITLTVPMYSRIMSHTDVVIRETRKRGFEFYHITDAIITEILD